MINNKMCNFVNIYYYIHATKNNLISDNDKKFNKLIVVIVI